MGQSCAAPRETPLQPFAQVAATIDDGNQLDETVDFAMFVKQEVVPFDQHPDARANIIPDRADIREFAQRP